MIFISKFHHSSRDDMPVDYEYSYNSTDSTEKQVNSQRINPFGAGEEGIPVHPLGDSIPENPFQDSSKIQPLEQTPPPVQNSRRTRNRQQPQYQSISDENAQSSSVHYPDDKSEIPQWLRIAQRNLPNNRHHATERDNVNHVEKYKKAGYPSHLYEEYLENMNTPDNYRQTHGVQIISEHRKNATQAPSPFPAPPVKPPVQPRQQNSDYKRTQTQYVVVDDEPEEKTSRKSRNRQKKKSDIPYLGILSITLLFVCIGLWLSHVLMRSEIESLISAENSKRQQIINTHPLKYEELIEREARNNNLHPAFVAAIILNESSFRPDATSGVGARGLMQLMEETAGWVHEKRNDAHTHHFDDMYIAENNVAYGCWYLSFLSDLFHGDPILVASAYHAGQTTVKNWLNDSRYSKDHRTIKLEDMMEGPTKQYATRVLSDYSVYKRLYYEDVEVQ